MLLSPLDVLIKGLDCIGLHYIEKKKGSYEQINFIRFRKHFGSSPLDVAEIWFDLTTTDIPEALLDDKDKSEKGFRAFMVAHHFLWTYPKNSQLLADRFSICESYARGEPL